VHSDQFSAIVSPRRGGAVEEYTVFASETNYANTLTRRREAYHDTALENQAEAARDSESGTPSIHDIEEGLRLEQRPPLDADDRALFVDRVLPGALPLHSYASGDYWPVRSWAQTPCQFAIERSPDAIEIRCSFLGPDGGQEAMSKRLRFEADGALLVSYRWIPSIGHPDDRFAPELSLFAPLELRTEPDAEIWTFAIETVAKSERGFDRTKQGDSVTLRWPVHLGEGLVELGPASRTLTAHAEAGKAVDH
jgi:hypothetical protein